MTLISPASGATDVAVNQKIVGTFSEAMAPETINNLNFTVKGVSGTVNYDPVNKSATFVPTRSLPAWTTFIVTMGTAMKDLVGNPMAAGRTWTFTTGLRSLTKPVDLGMATSFGCLSGGAGITKVDGLPQTHCVDRQKAAGH